MEAVIRSEKRRDRRPRIVKFADDEHLLASIDEEPDSPGERRISSESGSKSRNRTKDAAAKDTSTGGKENSRRKNASRKSKIGQRKTPENPSLSSDDTKRTTGSSDEAKLTPESESSSPDECGPPVGVGVCEMGKSQESTKSKADLVPLSELKTFGSGDVSSADKDQQNKTPRDEKKTDEINSSSTVTTDSLTTFIEETGEGATKGKPVPSLELMAQEALTRLADSVSEEKAHEIQQ